MRNFLYLDEYKMYSLSSQLFEGVTDYILHESKTQKADNETQKGPVASGRVIAEIIETTSASIEKKFLHDYAYSIFEDKLSSSEKLTNVDSRATFQELNPEISGNKFVRITARAQFLDSKDVVKTLDTLVDMQDSISIISNNDIRLEIIERLNELGENKNAKLSSGPLRAELSRLSKSQRPTDEVANEKIHYKHLSTILAHGFKSRLDISMQLSDCVVSADLKRKCLKDDEDFTFKTYSRVSNVELVILGIITQYRPIGFDDSNPLHDSDSESMRDILRNSANAIHGLERQFTSGEGNEIVLDPIAVYLEL
ncbi:hypothetical protein SO486_05300 [Pseudomonas salmasensis]|uniref:Uncharacterized protein n=1 Tax=Pseudomonas salmasensis TaxID=2745514 RepID=A0ABU5FGH3_9PSED|nr:hypothetical protein [Pseudomonas salmasensis]MDY4299412.1 hypothetical protein [Pseudomonas salmasensis]